jgi:hypothetical protein
MRASDLISPLPYQLDDDSYAVAAYVCTPNIAERMEPLILTLEVDKQIGGQPELLRPYNGMRVLGDVRTRNPESIRLRLKIYDDVTWIRFSIK